MSTYFTKNQTLESAVEALMKVREVLKRRDLTVSDREQIQSFEQIAFDQVRHIQKREMESK